MMAYGAATARTLAPPATVAAGGGLPPIRLTRAQFIAREAADRHIYTEATEDGVIRWGVRYLALPCHVDHPLNPGWALVRDDLMAIAHYERLFGSVRP